MSRYQGPYRLYRARTRKPLVNLADLPAWTFVLAVFGFPMAAVLTSLFVINDGSLSIAVRVTSLLVSALLFFYFLIKGRLRLPNLWPFVFACIYLVRLVADWSYGDNPEGAMFAIQFFLLTNLFTFLGLSAIQKNYWDEANTITISAITGGIFLIVVYWLLANGNVVILGGFGNETTVDFAGARLGFERLNPILLGQTSGTIALCCLSIILSWPSKRQVILASVLAIVALYTVYLAASRGPILSLFATVIYLIIMSGKGKWVLFGGIAALLVVSAYSLIDFTGLLEATRFLDAGSDSSSLSRFELVTEAFETFLTSPIYGARFDLPISGGWPHNIFAEVLMATGIVGGLVFAIVIYQALSAANRLSRRAINLGSIMLLQGLIELQFSGSLWGSSSMWIGIAMVNGGLGREGQRSAAPHLQKFRR